MKHFSAEKWSDYVRNQSPPQERMVMQAHLEDGCGQCSETVAWLEQVVQLAAFEASIDVPPEAVVRAQSIFRVFEANDWVEKLQQLVAEIVFETPLDWQPAGVRSVESDAIRLLYRAGDYAVDLKVEPLGGDGGFDIVGQVGNEHDAKDYLGGALVQIVSAGRTVGETETNQFGEFIIEQPEGRSAVLRIALRACGKRIEVPLQNRRRVTDPS